MLKYINLMYKKNAKNIIFASILNPKLQLQLISSLFLGLILEIKCR